MAFIFDRRRFVRDYASVLREAVMMLRAALSRERGQAKNGAWEVDSIAPSAAQIREAPALHDVYVSLPKTAFEGIMKAAGQARDERHICRTKRVARARFAIERNNLSPGHTKADFCEPTSLPKS